MTRWYQLQYWSPVTNRWMPAADFTDEVHARQELATATRVTKYGHNQYRLVWQDRTDWQVLE